MSLSVSFLLESPLGTFFDGLLVLVSSVDVKTTNDGQKEFLLVTVQDKTARSVTAIWDNVELLKGSLASGNILKLSGKVEEYQGEKRIKVTALTRIALSASAESLSDYVLSYDTAGAEEFILQTVSKLSEPWKGMIEHIFYRDEMCGPAGVWESFRRAPAARTHHQNRVGGLILHTAGMVNTLDAVIGAYSTPSKLRNCTIHTYILRDRLIFCAVLHDLCKVFEYTWSPVIAWNPETLVGHQYEILCVVDRANAAQEEPLTYPELQKVKYTLLSHHGAWGDNKPKSLEDHLLHSVDMIDAKCYETFDGQS